MFLDEIGELRSDLQVKLLRVLQEGEVDPIGSKKTVKVDVRVISATNRDLANLVAEGSFREDLYYRLNVFPIHIPPLRHRNEDVPALVERFISTYSASEDKTVRSIEDDALQMLMNYEWPGNVRQIENTIFRAVVLCDGEILTINDFPQIAQAQGMIPTPDTGEASAEQLASGAILTEADDGRSVSLKEVEKEAIRLGLERCSGQMSEAARQLGIGRSTLYRKVREYGLDDLSVDD